MTIFNTLIRLSIAALICLQANMSYSQDDAILLDERYDNWYQIELIIFDRATPQNTGSAEAWPNNIELLYPTNLEFLFTQEEWDAFIAPTPIEDIEEGVTTPAGLAQIPKAQSAVAAQPGATVDTEAPSEEFRATGDYTNSQVNEINALPELETPRIKLDENLHSLTSEAKRLMRRPGFRILFHEAWRQPLFPAEDSFDLAITGGDNVEQHFELEGSIKLSLSRYLHIQTNLWRNFFVPNYGQELKYWPPLPTLPRPTKAQDPLLDDLETSTESNTLFSNSDALSDFDFDKNLTTDNTSLNLDLHSTLNSTSLDSNLNGAANIGFTEDLETQAANLVSEIITLKQKRRMRSNELHYIDHPRLGLLIKITPYDVELPKKPAPAMEEAPTDQDLMEAGDSVSQN